MKCNFSNNIDVTDQFTPKLGKERYTAGALSLYDRFVPIHTASGFENWTVGLGLNLVIITEIDKCCILIVSF